MELISISIEPYVLIVFGLLFTILALRKADRHDDLKKDGILVEGIVYKNEYRFDDDRSREWKSKDTITVRFVTLNKEWITAPITQDHFMVGTGMYKEGQKIMIHYDPNDPQRFYVDQKIPKIIAPLIFGIIALGLIGIGLYQILFA